jgi:hypothetical protein
MKALEYTASSLKHLDEYHDLLFECDACGESIRGSDRYTLGGDDFCAECMANQLSSMTSCEDCEYFSTVTKDGEKVQTCTEDVFCMCPAGAAKGADDE